MKPNLLMAIILPAFAACQQGQDTSQLLAVSPVYSNLNPYLFVRAIPTPIGFSRIAQAKNTFGDWLRQIALRKNKTVYLYNGLPKQNQSAQFAVLDISTGNKDLQQCADAVMRLRAEYLYNQKRFEEISFRDNNRKNYTLGRLTDRAHFDHYLDNVFSACGSLSLQQQLNPVMSINNVQPGDVLIEGGSPGHAMIVMDMAENSTGKKIYLLAQSYMPAQDIHIVVNPVNREWSPWVELNDQTVYTPEWTFTKGHFRTWP